MQLTRGRDPISRRAFLCGATALVACGPRGRSDDTVERGVRWLLAQQGSDGGFHSAVYGLMRSGASLTALATMALQATTDPPAQAIERALAFLVQARGASGALGIGDVHDYPTYATAMAAHALAKAGRADEARPFTDWLLRQQLRGDAWGEHPARGGFPMGTAEPRTPPHAGHVDLSMSRTALEALRACGVGEATVWDEARRFVLGCRTQDAGFRYSPADDSLNKGRDARAGYGTATADGILALLATGGADEVVRGAVAWLASAFRTDENPGIGPGSMRAYAEAMRFYWRSVSAAAFRAAGGGPTGWEQALRTALAAEQAPDGSWRNDRAEQKEDDPIVATALALRALAACGPG
jgi:prenyltransferase beta subunit